MPKMQRLKCPQNPSMELVEDLPFTNSFTEWHTTLCLYPFSPSLLYAPNSSVNTSECSLTYLLMIGIRVAILVSDTFITIVFPPLSAIPKIGVLVLVERPCVPSTFLDSCLFVSLPPRYISSISTSSDNCPALCL